MNCLEVPESGRWKSNVLLVRKRMRFVAKRLVGQKMNRDDRRNVDGTVNLIPKRAKGLVVGS